MDEGTRLLKNILSLNYDFSREPEADLARRQDEPWLFVTPFHMFKPWKAGIENDDGNFTVDAGATNLVENDEGMLASVFGDSAIGDTTVTLTRSGDEEPTEHEFDEFDEIGADSGVYGAHNSLGDSNNSDEPWVVTTDDDTDRERAVYLGSDDDFGAHNSSLPVPSFKITFEDGKLAEVQATAWYWFTGNDEEEGIDNIEQLLAGYGVALRYDVPENGDESPQDMRVTEDFSDEGAITGWDGVCAPNVEECGEGNETLRGVDFYVMLDTTGVLRSIAWQYEDEGDE